MLCNLIKWLPYFILLIKILVLCVFAIIIRGTLPRYRIDQFTQLNWKNFVYIWVGFLVFTVMWYIYFI